MTLINQDIKNLVSGVSQQPAILRHPEQLEAQLNGFSSEAAGLQKRPPSMHIAQLMSVAGRSSAIKPLIHFIDRDEYEKYIVLFDGNDIKVFDAQGVPKTVNIEEDANYVQLADPRRDLKCITIADYTFIVNKNVEVAMSNKIIADKWATQGALVNIKSGQYGRTYRITINDIQVASFQTPDGSDKAHTTQIATDYIASQLAAQAQSAGYTTVVGSSWLYITKSGMNFNTLEVYDGYNNQAAFGILRATQKFSNLPASAPDGFTVKVAGDDGSLTDDYYIEYSATDSIWKECARPGILCAYDLSTMPHVLVREADGTFSFRRGEWDERDIGDDDSNPEPSFIGFTLADIFYFRNRLGVIAGENVILSRSAGFFNFWMTSAIEVQDTDPIDLAVSDNGIATLIHAVPYDEELVLFSKDAQFLLRSDSTLSPKDSYIPPAVTHYGNSYKAKPACAGRNLYFAAERSQFTTIREFFTAADNTERKDAQDITSHIANYVPNGVYKLIPSTIENLLLFLSEGAESKIFIYKYLFIDSVRQQAAWSEWDFGDKIYGADFMDSYLYIVTERNGYLCLERMSFSYNTTDFSVEPYRVYLDRKVSYVVPGDTYDAINDETRIMLSDVYGATFTPGKPYAAIDTEGTYRQADEDGVITFIGDYTGNEIIVGLEYLFKIVFSTIWIKQEDNGRSKAITDGRLQLKSFWVNYNDSGYFKVIVRHLDKATYEYANTSRILGTSSNLLDVVPLTTGTFKVPVQSVNTNCQIEIETDSPNPIALTGAGWTGDYFRRTKQY